MWFKPNCSVADTCCLFPLSETTMQKSVVLFSTFGYKTCLVFAVLRLMIWSQPLKHFRKFWTISRGSIPFIDLNLSQVQRLCSPTLKGHLTSFVLLDSSAFEARVLVFGLSRLRILFLSNNDFFCSNKFSWIAALEASLSKTWSIFSRCLTQFSLCFEVWRVSKLSWSVYHIYNNI